MNSAVATSPRIATNIVHAVIARAELAAAVAVAIRSTERKAKIPILSNVLIASAGPDAVTVTGTDLDQRSTTTIPAAVDPGFAVTLTGKALHDALRKSKASEHVAIDVETGPVKIAATLDFGGLTLTMQGLPAVDFPGRMNHSDKSRTFTVASADLLRLFDRTAFAVSNEATRYYLNGVFLHAVLKDGDNRLRSVATDGHRLAHYDIPLPVGAGDIMPGIVPLAAVTEIVKLLSAKGAPEQAVVTVCGTKISVEIGRTMLFSKLIDGTFPDYMKVIPRQLENMVPATFKVAELADALSKVTALQSDRGRAFRLEFVSPVMARLTIDNPDIGTATADVVCEFSGPEGSTIGFNAGYLLEMLGTMADESHVIIGFPLAYIPPTKDEDGNVVEASADRPIDPGSPVRITNASDPMQLGVLMPMRV